MDKTINQKAWFLVLPVFLVVAFSAILPLMTVVNYSMQDTFGNNQFFWNGVGWFKELLDPSTDLGGRFLASLGRNLLFSAIILAIEVPLGIVVALSMPREGWTVAVCLVILALPLLIPWNVVGTIWQIFGRPDIGLLGYTLNGLGIDYNYVSNEFDAWATVIVMDVWHWTSLVALLCYAGLKSIPDAYYQAAQIDGASRWAVFKAIQLPKMNRVLLIAVLLRFMDSFMIYTEPFVVTGGGPGNSTTFVSIELVKIALGQFDLGKAAALSLVYNSDHPDRVLDLLHRHDQRRDRASRKKGSRVMNTIPGRRIIMVVFLIFLLLPIYWLVNMSFKNNTEIVTTMTLWPHQPTLENYKRIFTDESWYSGYINSLTYVLINTVISISVALPAAYALLALPLPRRQASVLLAAVEPHGAGGGLCAAVLQSLFGDQPVRYALGGRARALHLQCAAGGLDSRRFRLGRTARDRRNRVPRRLFVPAILRQDPGAADRERYRRRRVLLLHVLLGRVAAGAHVDVGQRQADLGHHDAHGLGLRHGLGPAGGRRRAHHHPRRPGDLVRPQLHRARLCAGTGVAMEHIAWMAWTLPTAIFFVMMALTLGAMTWLAAAYPEAERVGVLRIPTTRGDRLFISLVLAAVIHLLWIAFVGIDPIATLPIGEGVEISSLWLATVISLLSAVAIFRTV